MSAIKLTAEEANVTLVSTKSYEVLPELIQTRAGLNVEFSKQLCDRLRSIGTVLHLEPVLIYELSVAFTLRCGRILEAGTRILADGHHRHDAVTHLPRGKRESIRAYEVVGTMEEAILAGLEGNKKLVDRVLTNEDRQHAVKVMLRNAELNSWSDNGISGQCGVSAGTVKRCRLQIREREGIPLPAEVQAVDSDGKPTGIWMPYNYRIQGKPKILTREDRNISQACIDGERISLPLCPTAATAKLDEILTERECWTAALRTCSAFATRLRTFGVHAELSSPGYGLPSLTVGTSAVAPFVLDNFVDFKAAALNALCARKASHGTDRAIVVGYFGGCAAIGRFLPFVVNLVPGRPLELMTPEEFVAEFGPKDGESVPGLEGPLP